MQGHPCYYISSSDDHEILILKRGKVIVYSWKEEYLFVGFDKCIWKLKSFQALIYNISRSQSKLSTTVIDMTFHYLRGGMLDSFTAQWLYNYIIIMHMNIFVE